MQSLLDVVFWSLLGAATLVIFDVPLVQVYVPLGTLLVSASFAIGASISNIVSSLIFVLATRPFEVRTVPVAGTCLMITVVCVDAIPIRYQVGDRITASGVLNGDEPLIVKRIDVLTTTFTRIVNKRTLQQRARYD